jgi:hypothetical protein
MKDEQGYENLVIHEVGTAKALFPFKRQHAELAEKVIAREECQHGHHSSQDQPVMVVATLLFGLDPSNDKESRKQCGHGLAQIGSERRVGPQKARLLQEFKHCLFLAH